MKIMFINNDGGFVDHADVDPGTTRKSSLGHRIEESPTLSQHCSLRLLPLQTARSASPFAEAGNPERG